MHSGPSVKEKFTVKCGDCNKSLLEVIITDDGKNILTKLKVHCSDVDCGGSSFLIPIQGAHRIAPTYPLRLKDVKNSESREEVWLT